MAWQELVSTGRVITHRVDNDAAQVLTQASCLHLAKQSQDIRFGIKGFQIGQLYVGNTQVKGFKGGVIVSKPAAGSSAFLYGL